MLGMNKIQWNRTEKPQRDKGERDPQWSSSLTASGLALKDLYWWCCPKLPKDWQGWGIHHPSLQEGCLTNLLVKKCFLRSSLNLSWCSSEPFLSLHAKEEISTSLSTFPPQDHPCFLQTRGQFNGLMLILTLNEEGNLNMPYPQYYPECIPF